MTDKGLLDFSFAPVGGPSSHMMPPPSNLNHSLMMHSHLLSADISFQ